MADQGDGSRTTFQPPVNLTGQGAFSSTGAAPEERVSVAEQLARRLLDLIRSRNLRPGDELPSERRLAEMMGVSQPTVREALRGLQILGAIRWEHGGGCRVSSLDLADMLAPMQFLVTLNADNIGALHQARLLVEGGIGRMAAAMISDQAIARLREIVAVQAGLTADPIAFRVSDLEFHQLIVDACDNPFLDRIASSLYTLGMEYRRIASETPGVIEKSVSDHAAIVDALTARDRDGVGAAMEEHVRNIERTTREAMMRLAAQGAG